MHGHDELGAVALRMKSEMSGTCAVDVLLL